MTKLRKDIAYIIIAKFMFDCRYSDLSKKAQECVINWFEDNEEIAYKFWKLGYKVWRSK